MEVVYIAIGVIVFVLPIVAIVVLGSPAAKGRTGEKHIAKLLEQLPPEYTVLNDVVLKTERGTTQIDHVVISTHGIYAIETKNYGGDIYGNDQLQDWKQIYVNDVTYRRSWKTYIYVTKNLFYNPVKQALGHVYAIRALLSDYPHLPIVPIVVFFSRANLSRVYTNHVVIYDGDLLPAITKQQSIYLSDEGLSRVIDILTTNNIREQVSNRQHVRNIRRMHQDR